MATHTKTTYTYADLEAFPDDNLRREIIDGELIVTASPVVRHQQVVVRLIIALGRYAAEHGGEVLPAPMDVFFSDTNVVEPDVLFVRADHLDKLEKKFVRSAPDLVIEVSSPSTRRLELVRKLELYERFGVPEYWYVDLDADRVEMYRLRRDRYEQPQLVGRGDEVASEQLPGFGVSVDQLLGKLEG
jgi:Uma2 family endonuclease